jgi:hypothetical protein
MAFYAELIGSVIRATSDSRDALHEPRRATELHIWLQVAVRREWGLRKATNTVMERTCGLR